MGLIDRLAGHVAKLAPATIQRATEDSTTTLPSGFVRRVLDMRDALPELARTGRPGFVHLSELIRLCARQQCLMVDGSIPIQQPISGAHRVMWKIGKAVEHHVRSQLIDGIPGEILGRWACACGDSFRIGHRPQSAHRCNNCNTPFHTYQEMTLTDPVNGVIGNPDIIIRHLCGYVPVEVKSMVKHEWDNLRHALGDHIFQACGYRRLLQTCGFPVHDDVVLIYTAKDFAWGSPYKEFHVRVTPTIEARLDELFAEARKVKEWYDNQQLPARTCCSRADSRRARNCPVATQCFGRA